MISARGKPGLGETHVRAHDFIGGGAPSGGRSADRREAAQLDRGSQEAPAGPSAARRLARLREQRPRDGALIAALGHLLRYFIPVSHMIVTMVASRPRCSANRKAARTLAPVEVPAKSPSSRASRRVMEAASSVETCSM